MWCDPLKWPMCPLPSVLCCFILLQYSVAIHFFALLCCNTQDTKPHTYPPIPKPSYSSASWPLERLIKKVCKFLTNPRGSIIPTLEHNQYN